MGEQIEDLLSDLKTGPTLTFDAPVEEEDVSVKEEEKKPELEEVQLTEEEKRMVDQFAKQIQLNNSQMILQYGVGAQKKISAFSETTLNKVKTKDLGEVGDMLADLTKSLKNFGEEEEEKGFFKNLFKKPADKLEDMKIKYQSTEQNVDKVVKMLESHQVQLMKDIAVMDQLYELNKVYFKELSMYIMAGKKKLEEVHRVELPTLIDKATKSGRPEDGQEVNDLQAMCDRFEKKIHDLELTRMISLQTAPQIRMLQNNDTLMTEKIQSTIVNTIPLWKSQMVLALGVHHSAQAAKAQREVTDLTNQLLQKNAETLKMSTIATAKESERGIVDLETLKKTNESLIQTIDEVFKIQEEGRQKRKEAEKELRRMEDELKQKLLRAR
ncbi:MAG TPA: toxic anion resistance protein [Candidatus Fimimorpha faecalis]|uniref:Toxic anion resistance protein n=1 Tax=Candidatus Fimimorpha faecalis TaxID=2840824 RepID=A0A9D1ECU4_9FIRM|nr:toxic anion resistance protein [Candidatus Fimimorpha faecalis]